MPSPNGKASVPSLQAALEMIYLATLKPELASHSLRKLVLANPNYFANRTDTSFQAVLHTKGETSYESIDDIRYSPFLQQLSVTLRITQEKGYSLKTSSSASREYVRFYLSLDGGVTWHDMGLSAVNVFDMPRPKPIITPVSLRFSPDERLRMVETQARVRAILSWNTQPPVRTPDWTPLWGNAVDANIQFGSLSTHQVTRPLPGGSARIPPISPNSHARRVSGSKVAQAQKETRSAELGR